MLRALVVDDSRATRMILARALARWGFEVLHAANGREALDILDIQAPSLDLVLLDWNMPELSGFEALEQIRARENLNPIRVVMVTTETEIDQMTLALQAGADEYVMKPFTHEALEDKLRLIGLLP